jgi:formylglycine-generating enzyme required for sulfatase activity
LALSKQLEGLERRRSVPAPTRSYPAELDIEMVFVEGGTFTMGCNGTTDAPCYTISDKLETPTRTVKVSNFSMGKFEITRAQWKAVIPSNHPLYNRGSFTTDDQLPIESISWLDIDTAFLPRLNRITGKSYRLPTSTEWEYAARGCKAGKCDGYKYSGSDAINDVAWSTGSVSYIVGQKKPNGLGIYDMSGNVWEWCYDIWAPNYYTVLQNGAVDPKLTECGTNNSLGGSGCTAANRVRRGGSFLNGDYPHPRPAHRDNSPANNSSSNRGFRVALPAQ